MRRLTRKLVWAALLFMVPVVVFVGAVAVQGREWIARMIVSAPNRGKRMRAEDDPSREVLAELGVSRQLRIAVGPPAASLSVWILEPRAPARATVLVLHGIRSDKSSQLDLGRRIAARGYRAVLPDLRGHGRSSGDYLTYGVVESRDLVQVVDALERDGLVSGQIGAVGFSYGAATAVELAALDSRVVVVVAIAPFTSLAEEVPAYAQHHARGAASLIPRAYVTDGIALAGRIGDFDPRAASPLDAITQTRARVLLLHGRQDTQVPPSQSEALHAAAPDRTRLLLVDADHLTILEDESGAIANDAMTWLDTAL